MLRRAAAYWIDRDDLPKVQAALETMMEQLRLTPAVAHPYRGLWSLMTALAGDETGLAGIANSTTTWVRTT